MSLRFWLSVAGAAAGGFSAGRAIEARAAGVPLDLAFKHLGTPIAVLKASMKQLPMDVTPIAQAARSLGSVQPEDATVLAERSLSDAADDN